MTKIKYAATDCANHFEGWWLRRCDHVLGRRDEWMALCWIIERVLLMLAGLWWLFLHIPVAVGAMYAGLMLLPLVVWMRHKHGQAHVD